MLLSCNNSVCNCNEIKKVYIENRAIHRFGGLKQHVITDELQIQKLCNEVSSFRLENNQQTRSFEGTILIKFVYHDKQGRECVENKYSTVIVFKDKENFITNSKGQFYDNMFIDKIMSYLKVSRFKFNDKKSFIKDKKNDKTNNREICWQS